MMSASNKEPLKTDLVDVSPNLKVELYAVPLISFPETPFCVSIVLFEEL